LRRLHLHVIRIGNVVRWLLAWVMILAVHHLLRLLLLRRLLQHYTFINIVIFIGRLYLLPNLIDYI
jgi:hypothetical protein